ncbi:MAG TPA: hypothetical protein VF157_05405, partial [Chloroflexota bacterium]
PRWALIREGALAAAVFGLVATPLAWYAAIHPDAFLARSHELSVFNPANGPWWQSWAAGLRLTAGMFSFSAEHGWSKNIAEQPVFDPVLSVFGAVGLLLAVLRLGKPGYLFGLLWLVVMCIPQSLTSGPSVPDLARIAGAASIVVMFPALAAAELWRRWPATQWLLACGAIGLAAYGWHQYFDVWATSPARIEVYRPGVLGAAQSAVDRLLAPNAPQRVYFGAAESDDAVAGFAIAGLNAEHPELASRLVGYDARYTMIEPPAGSESYLIMPGRPAIGSLSSLPSPFSGALGEAVTLLAYDLRDRAVPGETLDFRLQWQPGRAPGTTFTFFAHLLNFSQSRTVAVFDHNGFPADEWTGNEKVQSTFPLAVPADAPPGAYWLELGGYLGGGNRRVRTSQGYDRFLLGPITIAPPAAAPASPVPGQVGLLSADVKRDGAALDVSLLWLPRTTPSEDYSVFVHVLNPAGELVAQADSVPAQGEWPTRYWLPNVPVPDAHHVPLPATLPPGRYQVDAGLYRSDTGERLAPSSAGPEPGSFPVGTVTLDWRGG